MPRIAGPSPPTEEVGKAIGTWHGIMKVSTSPRRRGLHAGYHARLVPFPFHDIGDIAAHARFQILALVLFATNRELGSRAADLRLHHIAVGALELYPRALVHHGNRRAHGNMVKSKISSSRTKLLGDGVICILDNLPPVANAGGPYTIDEGANGVLDGSGSSDPDGDPITFEWDFSYDGVTFIADTSGSATPVFSAAALDGPDNVAVAVRVCPGSP